MIERSQRPTNVSKEEKDQAFHHRFRSLHFRSRAFLVTHPPFLSFIPGERNGEYHVFLPAWPARKMKIKQRGGMEKRRNERSRLRGKIESTSHPFFFFFLSSSAKQQGADIPRWFYRIGSTNKLRIAVAIIGYTCEAIDRGFFSKEVEMIFFRHSYCSYLLLLFIELYNVRFLWSLFITSGEIL